MTEPVRLVPYDSAWRARFEAERALLDQAIGRHAVGGIHHVGSTAVPGLDAKPVIDILVGIESLTAGRACFDPVGELGYLYAPHRADQMHWFCKPDPARRTHHLHLVPVGTERFEALLAFRDLLRADPGLRERYAALKRDLAGRHRDDRDAYTDGKAEFVRASLRARADLRPQARP